MRQQDEYTVVTTSKSGLNHKGLDELYVKTFKLKFHVPRGGEKISLKRRFQPDKIITFTQQNLHGGGEREESGDEMNLRILRTPTPKWIEFEDLKEHMQSILYVYPVVTPAN
jgi:hypothetical protein